MLLYSQVIFFIALCFWSSNDAQVLDDDTSQPEVTISQGTLRGTTRTTRRGRTVYTFLGIPYGQPPVGDLRFVFDYSEM